MFMINLILIILGLFTVLVLFVLLCSLILFSWIEKEDNK